MKSNWCVSATSGKKKEASTLSKQNNDFGKDDGEQAALNTNDHKKKKKKKKTGQSQSAAGEENAGKADQGQTLAQAQASIVPETEGDLKCLQAEDLVKEAQAQSSISSVKITEAATPQGQSETPLHSEVKKQVPVIEEASQPLKSCTTDNKDQSEASSKKKKKKSTSEPIPEVTKMGEEWHTPTTTEPEVSSAADASVSAKKKKRKSLRAELQKDAEAKITPISCEASQEETTTTTLAKKKKKSMKAERKLGGSEGESQANGLRSEDGVTLVYCEDSAEGGTTTGLDKPDNARTPAKKKTKKKSLKADEAHEVAVEGKLTASEITSEACQHTTALPLNEKTKKNSKQKEKVNQDKEEKDQISEDMTLEAATDESNVTPLKKKKKQKHSKITVGEEQPAVETLQGVDADKLLFEITMTTPAKKKKKSTEIKDDTQLQVTGSVDGELPLDESDGVPSFRKPSKKKRKIPVVFEYEADELEVAAEKETDAKTKLGNVSI